MAYKGIVTNQGRLLQAPQAMFQNQWSEVIQIVIEQMLSLSFIAGKERLSKQITAFIELSNVNETMVNSSIFHQQDKIDSYQIFSEVLQEINCQG
jgi:hypothetical protein